MSYPQKPDDNYALRDYNFGELDTKKLPMNEYLFKNGYKNAEESENESVPDAHNKNWFSDMVHRNLRYTQQVAEENKLQLETKVATPTSIGQIKVGYGLEITPGGVLSVVKKVAEDANVISYDLPVGCYMLWGGKNLPEYFIEPIDQELSRETYSDLWEYATANDLVADGNEIVDGKLYGIGDGSTTFKVFDIRDNFIKIATDNKTAFQEEAGLPNITGQFAVGRCTNNYGSGAFNKTSNSGAFSNYGNASDGGRYDFDASRSSQVYGKSPTVTPKNIALRLILKAQPTPPTNVVPTGTILSYTGSTAPDGFIIGNGAELSRTTFSRLYNWASANNLIKNQSEIPSTPHAYFGNGDGSTTFTIPNLRGTLVEPMIPILKY